MVNILLTHQRLEAPLQILMNNLDKDIPTETK